MNSNYLTDTHFHLDLNDNIEEILKRAKENGVNNFIISACDLKSIKESLEIINKYPVYLTIGIHPDEINDFQDDTINYLENIIKNNFTAWSNDAKGRCEGLYRRRVKEFNMFAYADYTGNN